MAAPSLILAAVHRRDATAVQQLLAAGRTAGRCEMRIITRLLTGGADINARAAGGYRPLHVAAFHDDATIVHTLLAHGATAEAQGRPQVARRLRGEMP